MKRLAILLLLAFGASTLILAQEGAQSEPKKEEKTTRALRN